MKKYVSSEYVGIGHPDKVADQISDTILDMFLEVDPKSRVAAETLVSGNNVIVAGEINSKAKFTNIEFEKEIIKAVTNAGYNEDVPCDFRNDNLDIRMLLKQQSSNIHDGVDKSNGDVGAGDQGIMFGYATAEVDEFFLPAPYVIAADILTTLNSKIIKGNLDGIYTDNKSQVCCAYEDGKILIEKIILSSFHNKSIDIEDVRRMLKKEVIDEVLERNKKFVSNKEDIEFFINSAGPFWIGGPEADAGLTGRKIIVDTYGGFAPHGGGAFSGKDPSKVDRSAAYMARHIAKNLVANKYCNEALVQLSYAIGQIHPFSISVKSDSKMTEPELIRKIQAKFDLTPIGIINYLQLTNPDVVKYRLVASGGHFFGRALPWEKIIKF